MGFKDCYLDEPKVSRDGSTILINLCTRSVIQKVTTVNTIISVAKSKALLRQIAEIPRPQDFRIHTGNQRFEHVQ
jgi:hypothetical protein